MPKFVYDFTEGNKDLKDILGGKGANLAEMTNLGLPVPPGFTITTDACRHYLRHGSTPDGLDAEVTSHLTDIEKAMGRTLGDPADPLLVSVRSGSKFSMPGMMDTVLNIGLSDESVLGLAKQASNERFAWDSYRRLIQMFGKTVLGIGGEQFERALDSAKRARGAKSDTGLDAEDLRNLTHAYKDIVREQAGREFPQDPREQLDLAIRAVFDSWNADRAVLYRRQERIPADLGTAVNVMAMVFGNLGDDSGTGVAFTRDPGSGSRGVYGDYLRNAQGEDVVAGIRNTVALQDLERIDKASYDELMSIMTTLEVHYRDLCDIEFTIEHGKLWMLQTRVGKRTAAAAFRIAIAAGGRGPHRYGRSAHPRHRRRARPADVPRVRHQCRPHSDRRRRERVARRGCRQGRLRLRPRRRARGGGGEGHPGPPGDQPGRPERHDRRHGGADQPRRQDQPRGRRRPGDGQAVRLRCRAARRGHRGQEVHHAGRANGRRGRRHLHRRHHR